MSLTQLLIFREAWNTITLSANAYACFICGEGKQESCCVTWYICSIAQALTASLLWLTRTIRPFIYLSSPLSKKGRFRDSSKDFRWYMTLDWLPPTADVTAEGSSQPEEDFWHQREQSTGSHLDTHFVGLNQLGRHSSLKQSPGSTTTLVFLCYPASLLANIPSVATLTSTRLVEADSEVVEHDRHTAAAISPGAGSDGRSQLRLVQLLHTHFEAAPLEDAANKEGAKRAPGEWIPETFRLSLSPQGVSTTSCHWDHTIQRWGRSVVQLLHAQCVATTQTLSDAQVAEGARQEGANQRKQVGIWVTS